MGAPPERNARAATKSELSLLPINKLINQSLPHRLKCGSFLRQSCPLFLSTPALSIYPVYRRLRTPPEYSPYNRQRWRKTASGQLPPTRARARLTISRSCLEERRQRLMRSHKPMASRRMTSRERVGGYDESGRGPPDAAPDITNAVL